MGNIKIPKEIMSLCVELNRYAEDGTVYAYNAEDNLFVWKQVSSGKTKKLLNPIKARQLLETMIKENEEMAKKKLIEEEELEDGDGTESEEDTDDIEDSGEEEEEVVKSKKSAKKVTKIVEEVDDDEELEDDDDEEEKPAPKKPAKPVKKTKPVVDEDEDSDEEEEKPKKTKKTIKPRIPKFDFEGNSIVYKEIMDKVKGLELNDADNRVAYKIGGRQFSALLNNGMLVLTLANVDEFDGATILNYKGKEYAIYRITNLATDKKAKAGLQQYIKEYLSDFKEKVAVVKEDRKQRMVEMQEARKEKKVMADKKKKVTKSAPVVEEKVTKKVKKVVDEEIPVKVVAKKKK